VLLHCKASAFVEDASEINSYSRAVCGSLFLHDHEDISESRMDGMDGETNGALVETFSEYGSCDFRCPKKQAAA
jgi:hypothetical protein